jgi:citrate lyase beta subunit
MPRPYRPRRARGLHRRRRLPLPADAHPGRARSRGLAAIDGPHLAIHDTDGLRRSAATAAALGYDGKWVLHPGQVDVVNQAFSPDQDSYERAEQILDAYAEATGTAHRGAVMLGDEMIDEASRKLAMVTAANGRAAGLTRRGRAAGSAEHPPAGQRLGQPAGQG